VDVIQAFKVLEWTASQKEGDVSEVYDKQLSKNVLKISGATSASNYIQVPATKNLPKQALGLTGKFVSLIWRAILLGLLNFEYATEQVVRRSLRLRY